LYSIIIFKYLIKIIISVSKSGGSPNIDLSGGWKKITQIIIYIYIAVFIKLIKKLPIAFIKLILKPNLVK